MLLKSRNKKKLGQWLDIPCFLEQFSYFTMKKTSYPNQFNNN
jgi:hypothetical protein